MKDIILKRNQLRESSIRLRSMRFEPTLKDEQVEQVAEQQNKMYNQWNFYDKFLKARDEVKNEIKSSNVGKEK